MSITSALVEVSDSIAYRPTATPDSSYNDRFLSRASRIGLDSPSRLCGQNFKASFGWAEAR